MTLEEAVAYLKEEDLATMAVGTYEVDGDFYFMIQGMRPRKRQIVVWKPTRTIRIFSGSFPARKPLIR